MEIHALGHVTQITFAQQHLQIDELFLHTGNQHGRHDTQLLVD